MSDSDYTTTISMRIPIRLVKEIDKQCGKPKPDPAVPVIFKDRTEAIIKKIELANYVESFKGEINKPEFLQKIRKIANSKGIYEELATWTPDQRRAIRFLVDEFEKQEHMTKFV